MIQLLFVAPLLTACGGWVGACALDLSTPAVRAARTSPRQEAPPVIDVPGDRGSGLARQSSPDDAVLARLPGTFCDAHRRVAAAFPTKRDRAAARPWSSRGPPPRS